MLASRLGVAALIIIVLSVFTGNRPLVSVNLDEDQPTESGAGEPSVTIGPLKFQHGELINEEDLETVRQSVDALRESNVLDEKDLQIIEMRLERQSAAMDRERALEEEALEAAGREIAQQLAAVRVAPSNNTQPDRLSEEEIQNLVVQRLLSVQTQIREDEESASAEPPRPIAASAPGSGSRPAEVSTVAPVAPSDAPPVPELSRPKRTLERLTGSFAGKTLMGTDFRNKDLSGLDFSNARLTASEFNGSDLTGANFSGAKLHGASFADAIMDRMNLSNAQAQTAHFERASMVGANLNHANFAGAVLTDADLRDATMESLNLNGAEIQGTILDEAP